MEKYSGTSPVKDWRKRTHVAARPATPEPTTATRIVLNFNVYLVGIYERAP